MPSNTHKFLRFKKNMNAKASTQKNTATGSPICSQENSIGSIMNSTLSISQIDNSKIEAGNGLQSCAKSSVMK